MDNSKNTRRNWLKRISAGMVGLIAAEQVMGKAMSSSSHVKTFNPDRAMIAPEDSIKITRL